MEHKVSIKANDPGKRSTQIIFGVLALIGIIVICITIYLISAHINQVKVNNDGLTLQAASDSARYMGGKLEAVRDFASDYMYELDSLIKHEKDSSRILKYQEDRKATEDFFNKCNDAIAEYNSISVMSYSETKVKAFQDWVKKCKNLLGSYTNQKVDSKDIFLGLLDEERKKVDELTGKLGSSNKEITKLRNENKNLIAQRDTAIKEKNSERSQKEFYKSESERFKGENEQNKKGRADAEKIINDNALDVKNFQIVTGANQKLRTDGLYVKSNNRETSIEVKLQVKFIDPAITRDTIYGVFEDAAYLIDALNPKEICNESFTYAQQVVVYKSDSGVDKILKFTLKKDFKLNVKYKITLYSSNCRAKLPPPIEIEIKKSPFIEFN